MRIACMEVENAIVKSFPKHGKGEKYKRGRKTHRASLPGQPPAVDTGRLKSSITHRVISGLTKIKGKVGTNVSYAGILEFRKNRPFIWPAIKKKRKRIISLIGKAFK